MKRLVVFLILALLALFSFGQKTPTEVFQETISRNEDQSEDVNLVHSNDSVLLSSESEEALILANLESVAEEEGVDFLKLALIIALGLGALTLLYLVILVIKFLKGWRKYREACNLHHPEKPLNEEKKPDDEQFKDEKEWQRYFFAIESEILKDFLSREDKQNTKVPVLKLKCDSGIISIIKEVDALKTPVAKVIVNDDEISVTIEFDLRKEPYFLP